MQLPTERPPGLDSPILPKLFKVVSRLQVQVYRATGGRVGGRWRVGAGWKNPVATLLLDHRGRTSGRAYTTPLLYLVHGRDLVVVASQGGLPKHPQWYLNLVADPQTTAQVGPEVRPVTARVAEGAERAALWPLLLELYPDFGTYQSWTDREIPVIVLQPRQSG